MKRDLAMYISHAIETGVTEDDAIEEFCRNLKVNCFRGDLENTAGRLLKSAVINKAEAIVRVNGDSPLIDHRLIEKGCKLMRSGEWDLVR